MVIPTIAECSRSTKPCEINALDVGQSDFFEFLGTLGRIRNQDNALQIGGRITLWENDEQLAYARRTDSAWSVALAQLRPDQSMEILRRPWRGEVSGWNVVLGDVHIEATDDGWRFTSGESGFSLVQPVLAGE